MTDTDAAKKVELAQKHINYQRSASFIRRS
jgi:hypothetical protein